MSAEQWPGESPPESNLANAFPAKGSPKLPVEADKKESGPGQAETPKQLTPDEQMALYEKELKENDWGHQPC